MPGANYCSLRDAIWRGVGDSKRIGSDSSYFYRVPKADKLRLQQLNIVSQDKRVSIPGYQYWPSRHGKPYGSRPILVYLFDIDRAEACLDRMKDWMKNRQKLTISQEDFESLCKN